MATIITYAPHTRRITLAIMLVLAVAVPVYLYAMVDIGRYDEVRSGTWTMAAVLGAVALASFLVVALRAPYADPLILPIALLINGVGVAMIHTVDAARQIHQGTEAAFAPRQLMWTGVGVVLALVVLVLLRDYRILRRYTFVSALAGIILLLLPLVPFLGHSVLGARIWIKLGSFTFQPAELAKICFAVFFAGYLVSRRDTLALTGRKLLGVRFPRWSELGPIAVAWLLAVAVLVFETDLGTSLLFFGLFVVALYIATNRMSWLVIGAILFIPPALYAATQLSHVQTRVNGWLHAFDSDVYYGAAGANSQQLVSGLFGMANGGLLGAGPGQGRPDLVPFAWSDFIVATIGEELGLVGLFALLLLYLVLVERAFRIGTAISDGFGKLLAGTLGFSVALQCFIVAGGVTRVIPLTGLTMPFLAAGGSSLVANWIIIALLIRMSDAARRPAAVPEEAHTR